MVSVRGMARAVVLGAMVLLAAGGAMADTHAPWPVDWTDWSDPALWATVGNPGNAGDPRLQTDGTTGYGSVPYVYKIGRFEVTARQYCEFLNAVARIDTYGLYNVALSSSSGYGGSRIISFGGGTVTNPYAYSVAPEWENRPTCLVSWGDAARFCNWLHNGKPTTGVQDLTTTEDGSYFINGATSDAALVTIARKPDATYVIPSEDEWYKAAYYDPNKPGAPGYWLYPTKSNTAPGDQVVDPDPGNMAARMGTTVPGGYYRTIAGEFENSASPYGTFDQGGNVWEWTEAVPAALARQVRGGSFNYNVIFLGANSRDGVDPPTWESDIQGFRVAYVPEPATLALLALGGLAMLTRRRR